MVLDSTQLIKVQNLTIENALRQAREWQDDIDATTNRNRENINTEIKKSSALEEEIMSLEENIAKLKREAEDLTQEINFNTQKEQMFKQ